VLFSDIKNEYGRNIYNWLRENTEKNVHYIDGGTKNENRDYFKKQMETEENTIIVASIGTFSEGISINNCHNIFIVESSKSEYIVRQMLGRGMRLLEGKTVMTVVDFCDNFIYGTHKYQKINYLMRHANSRKQIYKDRGFPYKSFYVKL
jgi:superfamily II DNA or RNA helicase